MTPQEALKNIGLNEKEIAIYLSCLELGQEAVTTIAKKAGLKRPTTYLVLESLRQRGLINSATRGKRTIYGVEEPNKLLALLAERERALKTVLPYLEALNNRRPQKSRIRFYEGLKGIRQIYNELMVAPEIRFWGSVEGLLKDFPDVMDWITKIFQTKKPKVFDLLTDDSINHEFADRTIRPGYEIRFFPKELRVIIDSITSGSKLAMIAFEPEPHGLIIESEPIVASFKSLWELAWRGATPYRTMSKK